MRDEELVIRGGTVIDGSGEPGRVADVAIAGDRITAVGEGLRASRELDASGQVVCPGFIDIHTHYDAQVFWDPWLTPSCFHGVTTVIAGNCGFSIAPIRPESVSLLARTLQHVEDMSVDTLAAGVPWQEFATFSEYLDAVSRRTPALNFACYVGHTAIRLYVMGDDAYERSARSDEVVAMQSIVASALSAGAIGFASSASPTHNGDRGRPVPSRVGGLAELRSLLQPLRGARRGVVALLPGGDIGTKEVFELQREVGRPFTWTALLTVRGTSDHERVVRELDAAWEDGAEVWPQITCRPLVFQMNMAEPFALNIRPSFAQMMGCTPGERLAAYRDRAWRAVAWAEMASGMPLDWAVVSVAESHARPDLISSSVLSLSEKWGCTPLDVLLDVSLADDLQTRFSCVLANDDLDGIAWLLPRDHLLLGLADSGAHVSQICDACFATDLLADWVRERQVMPLERAIHKLTGEPAGVYGLVDRGRIGVGMAADICVFDPTTVGPGPLRRVRDFPAGGERLTADSPTGIRHVLVNGTPIRVDGRSLDSSDMVGPGRMLRF